MMRHQKGDHRKEDRQIRSALPRNQGSQSGQMTPRPEIHRHLEARQRLEEATDQG
jgi:hypothetical protein